MEGRNTNALFSKRRDDSTFQKSIKDTIVPYMQARTRRVEVEGNYAMKGASYMYKHFKACPAKPALI